MHKMNFKSGTAIFSIILLSAISCKQQGQVAQHKDDFQRRRTADMVSSVKTIEVKKLDELQGLWLGRFEPESEHKEAIDHYNHEYEQFIKKAEQEGDYVDDMVLYVEVAKKVPSKFDKWMFKNPLFGYREPRRPNSISVKIHKVQNDSVWGTSICAGNERALIGTISKMGDQDYQFVLNEPGDDKYDGRFVMTFSSVNSTIKGDWTPYDSNLARKELALKRVDFQYKPDADEWGLDKDFLGKNISTDTLKVEDVENQSRQHLRLLRNLIYARHGYSFKNKDIRTFFEVFEWYVPFSTDIRNEISAIELKNISLMKRYEDYADDYYDSFGR